MSAGCLEQPSIRESKDGEYGNYHRFPSSRQAAGLGLNVCAFVGVSLSETSKYNEVINNLRRIPEVVECHFVTGKHALLLKFTVRTTIIL